MELVLLEVLNQRAACAMHNALGGTRGARGVHNEQGMIKGQLPIRGFNGSRILIRLSAKC